MNAATGRLDDRVATVAVTGAAGRLGSLMCPALRRFEVRALDRRAFATSLPHVHARRGDLLADVGLPSWLSGVDVVYHLAGEPSPRAHLRRHAVDNAMASLRLFDDAMRAGVRLVVYASSIRVEDALARDDDRLRVVGPAESCRTEAYAFAKLLCEERARRLATESTRFVVVRLGRLEHPNLDYGSAPDPPARHRVDADAAVRFLVGLVQRDLPTFSLFTLVGNEAGAAHLAPSHHQSSDQEFLILDREAGAPWG